MKWQDLELYERTPDDYYGKDKEGNEYGIFASGNIQPVEKGTIKPHWNYATIKEVESYIQVQKMRNANKN